MIINPYLNIINKLRSVFKNADPVLGAELETEALLKIRKDLIWAYSWAIPGEEALDEISRLGPILELGAGTGYWAWLLAQRGANVIAVDRCADASPRWFEVMAGDESVVARNPDRALLLCWPPNDEPLASRALRAYSGRTLIYIGEPGAVGENGSAPRTGDPEFHELLWNGRAGFCLTREIEIPTWPGYHDRVWIFEKGKTHET